MEAITASARGYENLASYPDHPMVRVTRSHALRRARDAKGLIRHHGGVWHEPSGKILYPASVLDGLVETGELLRRPDQRFDAGTEYALPPGPTRP